MKSDIGMVFDIQHLCMNDGPGIRTTIFFKGCPLHCIWCHNPESMGLSKQLIFRSNRCAGCGACMTACKTGAHFIENGKSEVDFSRCNTCGACEAVCCYGASEILGKEMSVEQILDEISPDISYYGDEGGITLSGGEPLLQGDFAIALSKAAKSRNIHICVETSGYGNKSVLKELSKYVDLFLFDYKATGDSLHKSLTGASQRVILGNLKLLDLLGANIVLRCPMIPSINDTYHHLRAIARLKKALKSISAVEILPYHRMGESKRESIGDVQGNFKLVPPSEEQKLEWLKQLEAMGCLAYIA